MDFEWDAEKAAANLAKHRVAFDEARSVFADPLFVVFQDPDHSIGERRLIILGESHRGALLVVAYVERNATTRLISARPATRKERKAYEKNL